MTQHRMEERKPTLEIGLRFRATGHAENSPGAVRWRQVQNNIHVPDELLAELQSKAAMEGKSVDELAAETLRRGLEDRAWRDLLEYGQKTGRESGCRESDVPDIIKRRRNARGR